MELKQSFNKGNLYISIQGDLDVSSALQMDNAIISALKENKSRMLIDCSELQFISSAGLGVFISHLGDIKNQNGSIVFYNMCTPVRETFKILGLDKLVQIAENEKQAKNMVDAG